MINDIDYEGIKFPVSKNDIAKIEKNICINAFCHENNLTYPVYVSDQKFENCMDLLLMSNVYRTICQIALCVYKTFEQIYV